MSLILDGTNGFTLPSGQTAPGELIYVLGSGGYAGANATGTQSWFGLSNGITVSANTVYAFEGTFAFLKTSGTTSHVLSLLFGGTATVNYIAYQFISEADSTAFTSVGYSGALYWQLIQSASATAVTAAQNTAVIARSFFIKGTVSINAGGTFNPQYQLSAAPGGAYTTQPGSYFKLTPLASGTSVNIGSWS